MCARKSYAIVFFALFYQGYSLQAQTVSWDNPSGGFWNVASNWAGGVVPASDQFALIDTAGIYTVWLNENQFIGKLTFNNAAGTFHQSGGQLTCYGLVDFQAGTYRHSNGELYAVGGLTTAAGSSFFLEGGTVKSDDSITINGAFNWSSGEITNRYSNNFAANSAVNLVGTGTRALSFSRTTAFNGGGIWDAGRFEIGSFTTLVLSAGQTITNTTSSGDFAIEAVSNAVGGVVENRGLFVKQGLNSTTVFNTRFDNKGTVDVQSGDFQILSGGTHSGSFTVQSGATLGLHRSTLNSGSIDVNGTGTFVVGRYGITTIKSSVAVTMSGQSTLRVENASFNLESPSTLSPKVMQINGGRLTTVGSVSPLNLTLRAGGTMWGTDSNLSVPTGGSFIWESGQIAFYRFVTMDSLGRVDSNRGFW